MNIGNLTVRTAETAKVTGDKIIIYSQPGAGKTSLAAHMENVLFIPAQGEETGIAKLAHGGLIPADTQWLPEIKLSNKAKNDGWLVLLETLSWLAKEQHDYKTIALDCFDEEGFLNLAYQHHADEQYGGIMGDGGFMSFQKGYGTVLQDIKRATHGALGACTRKGMDVVLLMHSTVATYKNPDGSDYNRHVPLCNLKHVWPLLSAWSDMVLFMNYDTVIVEKDREKAKAKGGKQRIMHCSHAATHEAKNRHGLPDQLRLPDSPKAAFEAFTTALKKKENN